MDIAKPVGSQITHVDFSILPVDEVRKLSAKQVTNPVVFDNLGHPVSGGLYDPAMGAFLKNLCSTCGLNDMYCPGHQGHVELPVPCFNPLFFNQLYIFLRSTCVHCHHFKLKQLEAHKFACKLELLQYGLILEASELDKVHPTDLAHDLPEEDDNEDYVKELSATENEKWRQCRELFVYNSINNALKDGRTTKNGVFSSTIGETRKQLILELYKKLISKKKCDNCGLFNPTFRNDGFTKIFQNALTDKENNHNRVKSSGKDKLNTEYVHHIPRQGSKYMLSSDILALMKQLFKTESHLISFLFNSKPNTGSVLRHDMFFIIALVVPPTRFRLPSKVGDQVNESPQNTLLSAVLTACVLIRDLNEQFTNITKETTNEEKKIIFNRLMHAFVTLQNEVNGFIDSTKNQNNMSKTPIPGVKQALEKKEGLFRKHMMGKRVNYAARSVISPDPMLETNQIGVPPVFAVKLTYPEPVTAHNVNELRQAVINGPDKWPGATQIQNEDGSLTSLESMSLEERKSIASQLMTPSFGNSVVNKKVHRHIKNNDVVLMNRQPTLHKASMMGHKVRVLPGEKTLRLHYANTGAYNADFDGDEMNMHFPQNENARAEAFNLANTDSQYLTPTSGAPVRGLIQDHISAGVWLTNKDSFFTREKYQELIYASIRPEDGHSSGNKILTVPPAIFKPEPLWTGKQIITTILLNIKPLNMPGINLVSKNKIKNDYWSKDSQENDVIFRNGELICGILDKSQYGASKYGIVHSLHEVYGDDVAGKSMSVLGRLFTTYIMMTGFTCGMDDLRLTAEGNQWRYDILSKNQEAGRLAAAEVANLDKDTKATDPEFKKRLEEILRDDNKLAILDAVTMSKVNAITSEVVSTCVPGGTMKKFPYNSMQSMALSGAKGSNVNVSQIMCMLGQQALEGRRVPVMVSGKTLPCFKPFDTQARAGGYIKDRFYSGVRPQEYYFHCMAGREGLIDTAVKTANSGYLQRCLTKQLEGVTVNYDNTVRNSDGALVQFVYGGDAIDTTKESHMNQFEFFLDNYNALLQRYSPSNIDNLDAEEAIYYSKKMKKHLKKQGKVAHYEESDKYDPTISVYNPSRYLGSVSDKFEEKLEKFIDTHPQLFVSSKESKEGGITSKKFKALMQLKYMRSVINPGEAVGIIASQSVGEPSTQMTLNTFHFAGHGAANVTLGIPRLREIVMTASASIKTPQMTLPVLEDVDDSSAEAFCKSVTKINFSEFIDDVEVIETTADASAGSNAVRSYEIKIRFFDSKDYHEEYDISKEELELVVRRTFISQLENTIIKELKKQRKNNAQLPDISVAVSAAEARGGKLASEEGSDEVVEKRKTKQSVSYDEPDEEELDAMREAEKSDEDMLDMSASEASEEEEEDDEDAMEVDQVKKAKKNLDSALSNRSRIRQQEVIISHTFVTQYDFDDENGSWCDVKFELSADTQKLLMVNIVEEVCKSCVVRQVTNIGRCLFPQGGEKRELVTEGVNFQAMWEHDSFVNVNDIRSNDVAAVLKTYGVEAARNTIVNEINRVFSTYAISVSSRHLDLLADYMTREGSYLAFNRQGIDSCTSSFMKMSYETTCQFLTKAVLNSDREELDSPSARLVMGKLNKAGTGSFDLLAKMPEQM